jgi:hypothetical protein
MSPEYSGLKRRALISPRLFSFLAVALTLASFPLLLLAPQKTHADITTGLIGYWPMNEGTANIAHDFSLFKHNGTLSTNGGSVPIWVNGKLGTALKFDGNTNYVTMGNSAQMNGLTAMTVSAWIKASSSGPNGSVFPGFAEKATCDSSGLFGLFIASNGATSQAGFNIYYTSGPGQSGLNGTTNVDDGNWHFVLGEYDGTTLSLWVDGVENAQTPVTGVTLMSNALNFEVGGNCNGGGRFYNGTIDEVRVYNRALSAYRKFVPRRSGTPQTPQQLGASRLLVFGRRHGGASGGFFRI